MISQFFVLSQRGDNIVFRDYRGDVQKGSAEIFFRKVKFWKEDGETEAPPVFLGPLDQKPEETIIANALFRLQSDIDDPHTFADLYVSSSDQILLMRACAYYPKYGLGAFGIFPMLQKKRVSSEDYGVIGLRYGSSNLLVGATLIPYSLRDESAWLVSKMGRLSVGMQYDPKFEKKEGGSYKNLKNWNYAIGYGLGTGSPLSPSFNFGLELAQNSQFIASFYQHVVVQRRVISQYSCVILSIISSWYRLFVTTRGSSVFNEPIMIDAIHMPPLGPSALFMQGNKRMPGTAVTKSVVANEPGGRKREEIFVDIIEKISLTLGNEFICYTKWIDHEKDQTQMGQFYVSMSARSYRMRILCVKVYERDSR